MVDIRILSEKYRNSWRKNMDFSQMAKLKTLSLIGRKRNIKLGSVSGVSGGTLARVARSMAQIQDKRANVDRKRTAFLLCGVPISENKVKRAREKHDYEVDLGLTYIKDVVPSQIGYFTPETQDEAMEYKGPNEDGYIMNIPMLNGIESAARGTDSQDSYHDDSQDSVEISEDWTNITREELEPIRANPETNSMEPVYEEDRELQDNIPSPVEWPMENLELSTQPIGMHGSSFIEMITSTHHSDLAYTRILETEGNSNSKSTELRCVWMSSGWKGRGLMGNLFEDEYDVVMSESWPFGATDYSSQRTLKEIRREFLIHQAMTSNI